MIIIRKIMAIETTIMICMMFKSQYNRKLIYNVNILMFLGRSEKSFETFEVSPDGRHLVFLGDSGYMILVSSKVCIDTQSHAPMAL